MEDCDKNEEQQNIVADPRMKAHQQTTQDAEGEQEFIAFRP